METKMNEMICNGNATETRVPYTSPRKMIQLGGIDAVVQSGSNPGSDAMMTCGSGS